VTAPPHSFDAFFQAVHGDPPFPWQTRLAEQVAAEGRWPDQLDLPTASGKTAALDVAVWHLALEADRSPRRAAMRVAFVVDRRLIVDEAHDRAVKIAKELADAKDGVLAWVAGRLRGLAGEGERPLAVQRLRGGVPRQDDWARAPNQPTILVSTVDQVGSRLMFRGYGVSARMAPVHAGLLGADALLLLDEAHLSRPFEETLAAIEMLRGDGPALPWSVAVLTATPVQPAKRPFGLTEADRGHEVLGPRLHRPKPVSLAEITPVKGASDEREAEIERRVKEAREQLGSQAVGGQPAIGIIVNRVARARAVFERLRNAYQPPEAEAEPSVDVTLLVGPARGVDRDRRAAELAPLKTGRKHPLARPMIVVATQTVEAGVDLDFDGLITEAAPLDALRQRWGRLNRSGRDFTPFSLVLAHKKEDLGSRPDPLYGAALKATWDCLQDWSADGGLDVAPDALAPRLAALAPETLKGLVTQTPSAPVLMPAYLDLWTQTSPVPAADPEPALFLHGTDPVRPSVQIVWREDLDLDSAPEDLRTLLAAMPPRSGEAVQVSLAAARRWLRLEGDRTDHRLNDLGDIGPAEEDDRDPGRSGRPALRWAGEESDRTGVVHPARLRPGDTIVVPASYGGCDDYGWAPGSKVPVRDVADDVAEPYAGRRFAVRVSEAAFRPAEAFPDGDPAVDTAHNLPSPVAERLVGEPAGHAALAALLEERLPDDLRKRLKRLQSSRGRLGAVYPYGIDAQERPRGVVLIAPRGLRPGHAGHAGNAEAPGLAITGDDELALAAGEPLALDIHSKDVECNAHHFAKQAGLPEPLVAGLALAGWLHDAGKADPRFQRMLGIDASL